MLAGALSDEDVGELLIMIDPKTWDQTFDPSKCMFYTTPHCTLYSIFCSESKDVHRKGILSMNIHEGVKLQLCYLLHHLCDVQLRHRIEYAVAFAQDYMGELQTDQLRRYVEIKQSDMPSAVAAKKTKEFRCPPREQV